MSHDDLKSLDERFQAMAQSDAIKQAPEHVEATLLAAFREQSKPRVAEIRRKRTAWIWAVAAAAAVVIVIFAATRAPQPRHEVAVVRPPAPVLVQPAAPVIVAAPKVAKLRAPQPKVAKAKARQPVVQEKQEKEVATEFMPVTPGEMLAPEESGRVIRVKLPRSALAAFGLPVNVDRFGERIPADLLLGEDGSTRAVRFVQTVSYR